MVLFPIRRTNEVFSCLNLANSLIATFSIEDAFLLMESAKEQSYAYMGKLVYASTVLQHAETEVGKDEMLKYLENTVSSKANSDPEEGVCINKSKRKYDIFVFNCL